MPSNRPTHAELIEAVLEFLSAELAQEITEPSLKFKLRIAVNALHIVQRELELTPAWGTQEKMDLQEFLQMDKNDISALNELLCERIRNGDYDENSENLVEILTANTLRKLSIDNPKYSTYQALKSL